MLDLIVAPYDADSRVAVRSRDSLKALEDYARSRLHQLRLPSQVDPRFAKLMQALADIPYVAPVDQQDLLRQYPELRGHVGLLEACLEQYPEILTGKIDPIFVIFPGCTFQLLEPVYRDNPIAAHFNKVVAEVVDKFVRLRTGKNTRILEVGAGTGGTTQYVLPVLNDADVEYVFTDVSAAFFKNARQRFSDYKFVKYQVYNVEAKPEFGQTFDIVIAANVIHATSDIGNSLRNIRSALSDDGILILREVTSRNDFATLTFGLLDGWWRNSDGQRIPNSPLLTGQVWRSFIHAAGFSDIVSSGEEDHQVIVAEAG